MGEMFGNITPEEAGIPSEAILNFIKQLEEKKVNIHSFLMLREDKIFAEGYWKPFNKEFQHRMYSAGKSFTSIAIGLLQEEGKLKITDHICDYFPDKLPKGGVHPYIAEITIKDMLKMATAHSKTTYKISESDDWVGSFFTVKPSHHPGTIFSYDTSSAHVLSALVERISEKSLIDYLREKVLNYIDFSKEAKFLLDPMGISQGGSGLICTTRDLGKFAYVCMNDGCYMGKQLIPKEYLQEATRKQIDNCLQPVIDEKQGYGYQFWKSRYNGFTLYGMGGQLAVCLPQYKIVFITTADTQGDPTGVQNLYEAFWQQIYPYITKENNPLPENITRYTRLKEKINSLEINQIQGQTTSSYVEKINGKKYILENNPMNIMYFQIIHRKDDGVLEYENADGKFSIPFLLGSLEPLQIEFMKTPGMVSASWVSENIFCLHVNLMGEVIGNVRVQIAFNNKYATILMKKSAEGILNNYEGIATGMIQGE